MGFITPTALALVALAGPIIIFYMLKLRRQPARVSSLLLWEQVLADRQANAPWQKLKRNLLLLLQLLILALLVMALARPYLTVQARASGNLVLLLDAAASMQATDLAPTRFAVAQQTAHELIDSLPADNTVTLITVAQTPRVLAATTSDRAQLRQALNAAQPTNAPADWQAALTLAAANAATLPNANIVILSDGLNGNSLPDLPVPVTYLPIGKSGNNQGIIAMSLRDGLDGPELFVRVHNAAAEPVERLVDIDVNGNIFDARMLQLPPHGEVSFTVSGFPLTARQIQAHLVGSTDILAADDTAWVVRRVAPTNILIVGEGNLFLERALALLPNVKIQRASPNQPLPQTRFDLTIFDRTIPKTLPSSNMLFIAPPASTEAFAVTGQFTRTRISRMASEHPLLTYLELRNLNLAEGQIIDPAPWMQTLVNGTAAPLLMAGQLSGQRMVVLAFDLFKSDWPLQIEFPIFVINAVRWLVPQQALRQADTLHAGEWFSLPAATTAETFLIRNPQGEQTMLTPAAATGQTLAYQQTHMLGVYRVQARTAAGEVRPVTEFAVNLLAPTETALTPDLDGPAGVQRAGTSSQNVPGQWEWWWLLVMLGLAVLLLEWWLYWRGEGD